VYFLVQLRYQSIDEEGCFMFSVVRLFELDLYIIT